jgi:hypothetical protein
LDVEEGPSKEYSMLFRICATILPMRRVNALRRAGFISNLSSFGSEAVGGMIAV